MTKLWKHHGQNATLNVTINACEDNAKSSLHHHKSNMPLLVLKIGYNDFPGSSNIVTIVLNHKTTKLFSQLLLCFHIVNCSIDRCYCVRARRSQVRNMKIKLPVNRNFSPIMFIKIILKTICTTYRTIMKKIYTNSRIWFKDT